LPPPAQIAALAPGWHERVSFGGHHFRALVREPASGDRAYLLYDVSALETRERRLVLLLAAGVCAIALAAWYASQRLAGRALAPLSALVEEIRDLNPERRGARLSVDRSGELGVIAQALNTYMRQLDALVERERAFAAAASHELRTPLAVIGGAAELLAAAPAVATGFPAPLRRIERAVEQARQDLDALLALSRGGAAPAASLDLHLLLPQWAAAPVELLGASAPRLHWRLDEHRLEAPAGSLHIVFTNLLRNALRAAGAGGNVSIELDAGGLAVVDDGPGIPAAELPQVFEPRFRGRDGGTGIGLYVAQTLAQREGWRLTLENLPAHGLRAGLVFQA
jgi:signal transduction histidine kinase